MIGHKDKRWETGNRRLGLWDRRQGTEDTGQEAEVWRKWIGDRRQGTGNKGYEIGERGRRQRTGDNGLWTRTGDSGQGK